MSVQQMRAAIEKVYPGKVWKEKVSKMTDVKVIAIYHTFRDSGKLR